MQFTQISALVVLCISAALATPLPGGANDATTSVATGADSIPSDILSQIPPEIISELPPSIISAISSLLGGAAGEETGVVTANSAKATAAYL